MALHNLKRASDINVEKWLKSSSLKLTEWQKNEIVMGNLVRFAPFDFFEPRKKVDSFWLRLTIIGIPIVWLLLFIGLPFSFLITGRWGYSYENIKWFDTWKNSLGL